MILRHVDDTSRDGWAMQNCFGMGFFLQAGYSRCVFKPDLTLTAYAHNCGDSTFPVLIIVAISASPLSDVTGTVEGGAVRLGRAGAGAAILHPCGLLFLLCAMK